MISEAELIEVEREIRQRFEAALIEEREIQDYLDRDKRDWLRQLLDATKDPKKTAWKRERVLQSTMEFLQSADCLIAEIRGQR